MDKNDRGYQKRASKLVVLIIIFISTVLWLGYNQVKGYAGIDPNLTKAVSLAPNNGNLYYTILNQGNSAIKVQVRLPAIAVCNLWKQSFQIHYFHNGHAIGVYWHAKSEEDFDKILDFFKKLEIFPINLQDKGENPEADKLIYYF
jgi:hypothetical protein